MTDIRELLSTAAGKPEPGDLLDRVRRVAARRTRLKNAGVGVGILVLAGVVGVGGAAVANSGRRTRPAVLAPSPTPPPVDAPALCTRSDLTVGKPTSIHVLAGEDGVDLPITVAGGGCHLSLGTFGFTPDAAVTISPAARPPAVFVPGATVHLVLTGESDGFCATVPHARSVVVTFRGSPLAALTLPAMGLCGQIDVDFQVEADHGEETSCSAAHLDARASNIPGGVVEILLRNTADYACFLQGTPTAAAGITATGRAVDLGLAGGVIDSLSLAPGAQAAIEVSPVGAGCLRPTGNETFTSLRLTLLNASGAEVTATPTTPFSFPCAHATTSGFTLTSTTVAPSVPPVGQGVEGPGLTVTPTSGPMGATLTVTGTVSPVSRCPRVRISTAADGASGAATGIVTVTVAGPASGIGTFSGRLPIPGPRNGEASTGRPAAVRAYCENADGSATNTGADPEVNITRTG